MKKASTLACTTAFVLLSTTHAHALTNYALFQSSTASSAYGGDYASWGPQKANDGSTGTKWCSNGEGSPWVYFYLGGTRQISQVRVKLASAGGEWSAMNAKYYHVQYLLGSSWITATGVDNQSQSGDVSTPVNFVTTHVALVFSNTGIDQYARIYEVEVLGGTGGCSVDPSTSSIAWPFSGSWSNKGSWQQITGSGLHIGDDQYAQDWQQGSSALCGANFYAPISGTVIYKGRITDTTNTFHKYGKQVVIQSDVNSNYAFRVAHLGTIDAGISVGAHVNVGTLLGTVGQSGGQATCHAHAVLYKSIYTTSPVNSGRTGYTNLTYGSSPTGMLNYSNSPYKTSFTLNASGCSNLLPTTTNIEGELAALPTPRTPWTETELREANNALLEKAAAKESLGGRALEIRAFGLL